MGCAATTPQTVRWVMVRSTGLVVPLPNGHGSVTGGHGLKELLLRPTALSHTGERFIPLLCVYAARWRSPRDVRLQRRTGLVVPLPNGHGSVGEQAKGLLHNLRLRDSNGCGGDMLLTHYGPHYPPELRRPDTGC